MSFWSNSDVRIYHMLIVSSSRRGEIGAYLVLQRLLQIQKEIVHLFLLLDCRCFNLWQKSCSWIWNVTKRKTWLGYLLRVELASEVFEGVFSGRWIVHKSWWPSFIRRRDYFSWKTAAFGRGCVVFLRSSTFQAVIDIDVYPGTLNDR